jgi:hypothetical protein
MRAINPAFQDLLIGASPLDDDVNTTYRNFQNNCSVTFALKLKLELFTTIPE